MELISADKKSIEVAVRPRKRSAAVWPWRTMRGQWPLRGLVRMRSRRAFLSGLAAAIARRRR
jgi:hypothetical protein